LGEEPRAGRASSPPNSPSNNRHGAADLKTSRAEGRGLPKLAADLDIRGKLRKSCRAIHARWVAGARHWHQLKAWQQRGDKVPSPASIDPAGRRRAKRKEKLS